MASTHKAGFVTLLGLPNAGKSSLLNALIQTHLAAVSPKAQTTRHRIPFLLHGEDYQIVLNDMPGLLEKSAYALHHRMMDYVREALEDSDLFLLVFDAAAPFRLHPVLEDIKNRLTPQNSLVVLNKADIAQSAYESAIQKAWPGWNYLRTSSHTGEGLEALVSWMVEHLPPHPPYFDKEHLSSLNMRFFISEIIREKIFQLYRDEIPYACHVEVDSYKEEPELHKISAIVYVEKESQKGILIGRGGNALKTLGTQARQDIELLTGVPVYLAISVKVAPGWRRDERYLKKFGYFSGSK
ncbi:MAG: GTPase Era [Flavobacteriales bacterium]|nr:GTPase Era [Flavobacteriales bacterium]MDW8431833.1 GTPase Era [Flavobacteriales bacterium]